MTVYPLVLRLGPVELTGYGLMMMIAFLMAGWAIQLDLRRRQLDEEYAADIVIAGVIGGLVGAKIWYVLLTGDWDALLRRGGFVWYGGLIGGAAGVLLNGWRKRVPARLTMELCAAPLMLGHALGRVGCFLVGDDYGIPSALPWAMKFPRGLPPTTVGSLTALGVKFPATADPLQVVAVHPTQIYETLLMFLAFWWIWRQRDHGHATGWLFGWYLVLAGLERLLVEFLRAKDDRLLGPFTVAQATSAVLLVAGVILLRAWREPSAVSAQPAALAPKAAPPPHH
ncbi:MAG TPA: prolipoprotein diacylglyceryl transferase [Gemmatimonadales bacterium]|jgi:phosphatidylglycerol:prolipoprotein diacylglycerol transferase|nr:prolipoprotein diacylglyceryl transferase [Gemmatimonadales bacterium]